MEKGHQSSAFATLAAVFGGGGFAVISAPILAGVLFCASAVLFVFAFKPELAQTRLHLPFRKKRPQLLPDASVGAPREQSLKGRALKLSDEILRFLAQRSGNDPALPRSGSWERDTQRMIDYSTQTMALYSRRFGARVIAMRNELAVEGFRDDELDGSYKHPTNPIGIRIVAESLGALAHQLTDA